MSYQQTLHVFNFICYHLPTSHLLFYNITDTYMRSTTFLQSFDKTVLSDELVTVLKRSPQTQHYVGNRVIEIISEIMSKPIIQQLQQRIEELEETNNELISQIEGMRESHSKSESKSNMKMQKYVLRNRQLEHETKKSKDVQAKMSEYENQIAQLLRQRDAVTKQLEDLQKKYDHQNRQIEKNAIDIKSLSADIEKANKLLETRENEAKALLQDQTKFKKLVKLSKYSDIKIKKQYEELQKKQALLSATVKKLQQDLKAQRSNRENERRAYHSKINELHMKKNTWTRIKKKMILVLQQKQQLSIETQSLRQYIQKGMKIIWQQAKTRCLLVMDEIGERMNRELQALMTQMGKTKTEIRILRDQVRIKDEIIEKLEKVSSVQVMGHKDLQKQLKAKKNEIESLKHQLRKNYQQSEKKLMGLESSYRKILSSSGYH